LDRSLVEHEEDLATIGRSHRGLLVSISAISLTHLGYPPSSCWTIFPPPPAEGRLAARYCCWRCRFPKDASRREYCSVSVCCRRSKSRCLSAIWVSISRMRLLKPCSRTAREPV